MAERSTPQTGSPCLWWIISRRPQHPDCEACRRAPGGPDYTGDSRDSCDIRDSRDSERTPDRQQHRRRAAAAIQPSLDLYGEVQQAA